MDWRHLGELLEAGGTAYDEMVNLVVWAKTNAGGVSPLCTNRGRWMAKVEPYIAPLSR